MENIKEKLSSISEEITKLRIMNQVGMDVEEIDKNLYDIDILVCKAIDFLRVG